MNSYYVTFDVDGMELGTMVVAKSYDEAALETEAKVRRKGWGRDVLIIALQLIRRPFQTSLSTSPAEGAK